MKAGLAVLAGLALLACFAPSAQATSSSVVIGYYQSFILSLEPAAGNLCKVGGVPTQRGITAPSTGQTTIAFTEGTGVHYMDINATSGYTAVDAVLSPSPALRIDTDDGISLVYNVSAASANDVASVTLVLTDDSDDSSFNCSATITFTVVSAPSCTAPPPPDSIEPYPSGVTYIQNPSVPTTIISQTINIINVQYNINIQYTVNNYNAFACACCFNSCNNYIIVNPPSEAPPVPTAPAPGSDTSPSPSESPAPEPSTDEEEESPSPSPSPSPSGEAPSPAPVEEEDTGSS